MKIQLALFAFVLLVGNGQQVSPNQKIYANSVRASREVLVQPSLVIVNPNDAKHAGRFRIVVMGTTSFPAFEKIVGAGEADLNQLNEFKFENAVVREYELKQGLAPKEIEFEFADFGKCAVEFVVPKRTGEKFQVNTEIKKISDAIRSTEKTIAPISWSVSKMYQVHGDVPQGAPLRKTTLYQVYRLPDGEEFSLSSLQSRQPKDDSPRVDYLRLFDGQKSRLIRSGYPESITRGRVESYQLRNVTTLCLDNLNQSSLRRLADMIGTETKDWDLKWKPPLLVKENDELLLLLNADIKTREYNSPRRMEVRVKPFDFYALHSVRYFRPDDVPGGESIFTITDVQEYRSFKGLLIPAKAVETSFQKKTGKKSTTRTYELNSIEASSIMKFNAKKAELLEKYGK